MTGNESNYELQFCFQRWIENARVAERADVWEKYLQIIDFWKTLPKLKNQTKASLELTRVMILSLLHLMSAIPHVHASTGVPSLMCEKISLCHFCL